MKANSMGMGAMAVAIASLVGLAGVQAAPQQSETLVYAVYDGQDTASNVYKTMRAAQHSTGERIESYAIVSKDPKGKVTVLDQRKRNATVGAVLGGVIGLVGGPPAVAAGAAAGGAVGFLTGDAVGIPRDKVDSMQSSLTPNSSALVVVLDDRWVKDVQHDLNQAHARAVIASQIAGNAKQ